MTAKYHLPVVQIDVNSVQGQAIMRASESRKSAKADDFVQGDEFFNRLSQLADKQTKRAKPVLQSLEGLHGTRA